MDVPPPPDRPKNSIFEDEDKSKTLSRLLRSKNPDDLQAANRLIKNMVKQDNDRMEKVSRRIIQLETVNNNVKLLGEMLQNYCYESSSQSDKEIMKELYESLEKLRPSLFRLASDADDKDNNALSDILKANDAVSRTLQEYKSKVEGISENGVTPVRKGTDAGDSSALLDLNFDQSSPFKSHSSQPAAASSATTDTAMLLEGELSALGLQDSQSSSTTKDSLLDDLDDIFGTSSQPAAPTFTAPSVARNIPPVFPSGSAGASSSVSPFPQPTTQPLGPGSAAGATHPVIQPIRPPPPTVAGVQQAAGVAPHSVFLPATTSSASNLQSGLSQQGIFGAGAGAVAMEDLDILGQTLADHGLPKELPSEKKPKQPAKVPLNQLVAQSQQIKEEHHSSMGLSPLVIHGTDQMPHPATMGGVSTNTPQPSQNLLSLTDVVVPLQSITPGDVPPVNAYDKNGIKIVMHFAKDRPQEHILVVVVSVMSMNTHPVKNFLLQTAVPKTMKVKLQPASASDLPAYNPILPLSAITQVMLIANPSKEHIRLKFKITYVTDDQPCTDVGDVDNFPVQ